MVLDQLSRTGKSDAQDFYSVDRIEGEFAILVGDSGEEHSVQLHQLPGATTEGTVLRVMRDADGRLDWQSAQIDQAEAQRRAQEAEDLLNKLRRRDPGGDVEL